VEAQPTHVHRQRARGRTVNVVPVAELVLSKVVILHASDAHDTPLRKHCDHRGPENFRRAMHVLCICACMYVCLHVCQ
jgi:hypothetical protein